MGGRILCALLLAGCVGACKTSTPGGDPLDAAPPDDPPDAAPEVCTPPPGDSSGKLVRVVFLVPSDRQANLTYVANLEHALRDTQLWLADKMPGGTSFRVHDPPVEVFGTTHPADYYATHVNGDNPDYYYWYNAVDDGFAVTGGAFDDPDNLWIYYLQADPACDQVVGGIAGVSLLPQNDLRGLVDEPRMPICPEQEVDSFGRCRWVGGMMLLILAALEVPQPAACEDEDDSTPCGDEYLTRGGFENYPDAILADNQLDYLEAHPFVRAVGLPECTLECGAVVAP